MRIGGSCGVVVDRRPPATGLGERNTPLGRRSGLKGLAEFDEQLLAILRVKDERLEPFIVEQFATADRCIETLTLLRRHTHQRNPAIGRGNNAIHRRQQRVALVGPSRNLSGQEVCGVLGVLCVERASEQ